MLRPPTSPSAIARWLYHNLAAPAGSFAGSRRFVSVVYRAWSKIYDASIAVDPAFGGNARRLVERLVRPGDDVLDLCCGTGLITGLAAPIAASVVGLDYSDEMLAKAARKAARQQLANVSLRWGDARLLPFDNNHFDVVISSFALPHFSAAEQPQLFAEMCRVLRPGRQLGLFLAQGELVPGFPTTAELHERIAAGGLSGVTIEDCDDVYRLVTALRPASQPSADKPASYNRPSPSSR